MTMICYIYKYSLLFFTTHNITVKEVLGNYWKHGCKSGIPNSMYGTNLYWVPKSQQTEH